VVIIFGGDEEVKAGRDVANMPPRGGYDESLEYTVKFTSRSFPSMLYVWKDVFSTAAGFG
jgi:hypothetical protein